MARNIDATIERVEKQLIKLKKEREEQNRRKFSMIGEAATEIFPDLKNITSKKDALEFLEERLLTKIDAGADEIQVVNDTQPVETQTVEMTQPVETFQGNF